MMKPATRPAVIQLPGGTALRRTSILVTALAAFAALSACSPSDSSGSPPASATTGVTSAAATPTSTAPPAVTGTPPAPTTSAAACRPTTTTPAAGETTRLSLVSGGIERSYLLYVPPGYDGTAPIPLVLNFHGLGSNGAEQHLYSRLVPLAERERFLVASPDGINRAWLTNPGVNDITFTRDLAAEIARLTCVDEGRVYATGMSNGGFMSAALACFAGDLVAAVAPVAGLTGANRLCGDPVPFIEFHGTVDQVVPYEGGILGPTGGGFEGVPTLMDTWAEFNGCGATPVERKVSDSVVFREFQDCDVPTGHYVVAGGGHTWPGAINLGGRLGETTREISAAEIAWEFFKANPR